MMDEQASTELTPSDKFYRYFQRELAGTNDQKHAFVVRISS